jgi:hypothetical protein
LTFCDVCLFMFCIAYMVNENTSQIRNRNRTLIFDFEYFSVPESSTVPHLANAIEAKHSIFRASFFIWTSIFIYSGIRVA